MVEILLQSPLLCQAKEIFRQVEKSRKVLLSKHISDRWKELVLVTYSIKMFLASFWLFFWLTVLFIPVGIAVLFGKNFEYFVATWKGTLYLSAIAGLYGWLRNKRLTSVQEGGYGVMAKLLCRLALGVPSLAEASFDLDQSLNKYELQHSISGKHIFIAGLARAGTTILMRRFYANKEFCSLTYRDMPFLLAPNLWHSISNFSTKEMEKIED